MEIRRVPRGNPSSCRCEFIQPATGPVSLKVGSQDVREYRAASLWHLCVAEPAECRQSLLPLLNLLQPNWDLVKTGDEVRAVLLRMADGGNRPDQKRWAQWVRQLGDNQFSKREAADRQLREAGRAVVVYLQQLDPSRLDAEQRFRIRRIINALTAASGDDSPEQVASWLFCRPGGLAGDAVQPGGVRAQDRRPAARGASGRAGRLRPGRRSGRPGRSRSRPCGGNDE